MNSKSKVFHGKYGKSLLCFNSVATLNKFHITYIYIHNFALKIDQPDGKLNFPSHWLFHFFEFKKMKVQSLIEIELFRNVFFLWFGIFKRDWKKWGVEYWILNEKSWKLIPYYILSDIGEFFLSVESKFRSLTVVLPQM